MRAWISAFACSIATFVPRGAVADVERVLVAELAVEKAPGAERCIEKAALASAVETRLGRRVFDVRRPPDLDVKVRLGRPRPNEWRAELVLLDLNGNELGRRELVTKARDCSALDASVALVLALLVDAPPNLPPPPAPPPEPAAESDSPAPPAEPAPAPPQPPRPATPLVLPSDTFAPREPGRVALSVSAATVVGVAPRPLFGAAVTLGFRPPRLLGFRVSGEFFPTTRVELAPDRGAELTLARFGVAVCPLESTGGAFRFEICGGQKVGWLGVSGFGFDENLESGELAYALEVGGSAFWKVAGGFGLWLAAAIEAPLVRNNYSSGAGAGARQDLFRATPVGGNAQIGAGIEF